MAVKRGLNMARGLGSLIPQAQTEVAADAAEAAAEPAKKPAAKPKTAAQKKSETASEPAKKAAAKPKTAAQKKAQTASAQAKKPAAKTAAQKKAETASEPAKKAAAKPKATAQKKAETASKPAKKAAAKPKTAAQMKAETASEPAKKAAAKPKTAAQKKAEAASEQAKSTAAKTGTTAQKKAETTAETVVNTAVRESDAAPQTLRISAISPNREQPRSVFEEEALQELADSIRIHGVLQPLLVQKKGNGYELIAGERRWRAARLAGLTEVPVVIREFSEQEAVEISLIENIQREDLNAIEEAQAYQRLMDEFRLTQEEVASRVTKSRSAVANSLRLLSLDEAVRDMLVAGVLSAGHARALLALEKGSLQVEAAQLIVRDGLSVRETERLINRLKKPRKKAANKPLTQIEAVYRALQEEVSDRIGSKVTINRIRGKKGTIEIEYYSQDDLERIIGMIR